MPVADRDTILVWSLGHWMRASRRLGYGREPATAITVSDVGDHGLGRREDAYLCYSCCRCPGDLGWVQEPMLVRQRIVQWSKGRGSTLDLTSIV